MAENDVIKYAKLLQVAINAFVVVAGTIGNLFLVILIARKRTMRNVTNYFVINLAIADLMIAAIVIPLATLVVLGIWQPEGTFQCTVLMPLLEHFAGVCVLTHTALSVARYLFVTYPNRALQIRPVHVIIALLAIWATSFLLQTATLMGMLGSFGPQDNFKCWLQYRLPVYRKLYRVIVVVLTYVIPMTCTGFAYQRIHCTMSRNMRSLRGHINQKVMKQRTRQSRKLDRVLMTMYIFFGLSTLPLQLYYIFKDFGVIQLNTVTQTVWLVLLSIFYLQVITNPFVLFYMGDEYRKQLYRLYKVCFHARDNITNATLRIRRTISKRRQKGSTESGNRLLASSKYSLSLEEHTDDTIQQTNSPITKDSAVSSFKNNEHSSSSKCDIFTSLASNNDKEKVPFASNNSNERIQNNIVASEQNNASESHLNTTHSSLSYSPASLRKVSLGNPPRHYPDVPWRGSRDGDLTETRMCGYYDDGTLLFLYDPNVGAYNFDHDTGRETVL